MSVLKSAVTKSAKLNANRIRQHFSLDEEDIPSTLVVLGTNGKGMFEFESKGLPLVQLEGFDSLQELEGHKREIFIKGNAFILAGRVHANESPYDQGVMMMVRLQVQMFIELGVKNFILTNAAGGLFESVEVGSINIADGFCTTFAPVRPMFAGEFVNVDDILCPELSQLAIEAANDADIKAKRGGYMLWNGPAFEGPIYDKPMLAMLAEMLNERIHKNLRCIGMSTVHEATVIATNLDCRVLALSLITNGPGTHDHAYNVEQGRRAAPKMTRMIEYILDHI